MKAKGYKAIGFNVFLNSLVADPGERPGGPPPSPLPPYFKTKRRPEGLKKFFGRPGAPHLKVWICHCSLMRSLSPKRLIWSRPYYFYSLCPLQDKGLNILRIVTWFGTTKHARQWGLAGVRSTGKASHWMAFCVRYWGTQKIPAFDREQAQRGKLASKAKQKFNGVTRPAEE